MGRLRIHYDIFLRSGPISPAGRFRTASLRQATAHDDVEAGDIYVEYDLDITVSQVKQPASCDAGYLLLVVTLQQSEHR